MNKGKNTTSIEQSLFNELSLLIEQSQQQVITQANSTITILFWHIGNRINKEILKNKRAEYAKQIVSTLSTQLKAQYGKNFEIRNLRRMMQFAEQFTDIEVILPLSRQLSWSHLKIDMKISRKNVLLLNSVIKRGLSAKDDDKSSNLLESIPPETCRNWKLLQTTI